MYFSQLITDDMIRNIISNKQKIVLSGGTGTGKSKFITDKLSRFLDKIYYCSSRKALTEDMQQRFNDADTSVITTQKIEFILKHNNDISDMVIDITSKYDAVVFDEVHLLLDDSNFNEYAEITYNLMLALLKSDIVVVLISATADMLFEHLVNNNYIQQQNIYCIHKDYSVYTCIPIKYSHKQITERYLFKQIIELMDSTDDKILYFAKNINDAYKVYQALNKLYNGDIQFACSKYNSEKHIQRINSIDDIKDGTYQAKLLICTTVIDVGIDLTDSNIKHIITDIADISTIIQCLGRKRLSDMDDKIYFYFVNYNQYYFKRKLEQLKKIKNELNMIRIDAELFLQQHKYNIGNIFIALDKYIRAPFINGKTNIIIKNNAELKLNNDILVLEHISNKSFKKVMQENLKGCTMLKEKQPTGKIKDLETFLNRPLYKKEKKELAELLNITGVKDNDRRIQRGYKTIAAYLKENYGLDLISTTDTKTRKAIWILKE